MNVKIGCDPELFLSSGKKTISAYGVIPGDKANPHKVKNGAVQVDGMALEFNIDPAEDAKTFSKNISSVLTQLKEMIPEGTKFNISPVAYFGEDYIKSQPKEAIELGCDPDFNAWNKGERNPRPNGNTSLRTASGHIHIGWDSNLDIQDPDHLEACMMMVKQLDVVLLPISMLWDKDDVRRDMYGAPGAFRPKPYGVEYRVLSNAWIKKAYLRQFIFDITKTCFDMLVNGRNVISGNFGGSVNSCINVLSYNNVAVTPKQKVGYVRRDYLSLILGLISNSMEIRAVFERHPKVLEMFNKELKINGQKMILAKPTKRVA